MDDAAYGHRLVEGLLGDPLVLLDGALEVEGRVVVGAHVYGAAVARVRDAAVGVELGAADAARLVEPALLLGLLLDELVRHARAVRGDGREGRQRRDRALPVRELRLG